MYDQNTLIEPWVKTHNLQHFLRASSDSDVCTQQLVMAMTLKNSAFSEWRTSVGDLDVGCFRFQLASYLHHRAHALSDLDMSDLRGVVSGAFGESSAERCHVSLYLATRAFLVGEKRTATRLLVATIETLRSLSCNLYEEYLLCQCLTQLARCHIGLSEFREAERPLAEAGHIARDWALVCALEVATYTGDLLWRKRDYAAAVEAHKQPEMRQMAIGLDLIDWLAGSHAAAGKAALDMRDLRTAISELSSAIQLTEQHRGLRPARQARVFLYQAELLSALGRPAEAGRWIDEAQHASQQCTRYHKGLYDDISEMRRRIRGSCE